MNLFFINFKHLKNEDFLYLGIYCIGNFGDGEYIAHRQTQVSNLVAIDQITIKTTNRERSSLLAFNRVYRLEIESVMLVFGPRFVNYCASNLLSGSPPPSPSQSQSTVYTDSVWLWGGWGVLSPVGDHILQKFKTLYLI